MPGTFEWRLLALEKQQDAMEVRMRDVEKTIVQINGKLDTVVSATEDTKSDARDSKVAAETNARETKLAAEATRRTYIYGLVMAVLSIIGALIVAHVYFK